ncbi:uncharacterized protein LOC125524348 isoform X2 [Triticum urartu]|uniref:FBD domain-containing protein n=1 Tax=Triticum aestivum TaxID=4565 RepID=A0A3B6RMB6_WHEAT|nr:uncharacterized protein LOC123149318 isoform X2 [Triticum aestivum]XP_048545370.1 uncharacterized protein LOC125524348 isoform X2 [Triticum urartu]
MLRWLSFMLLIFAHFEWEGQEIPIVLHGCSKLEKATIMFRGSKGLAPVFTLVPSILPVKLQNLTTRPHGTFMHLRHMTCQLTVFSRQPNADNRILQLARCLDISPRLETLYLDMVYLNLEGGGSDDVRIHGSPTCVTMIISRRSALLRSRLVCFPSRIMASSVLRRRSADGHSLPWGASVPLELLPN